MQGNLVAQQLHVLLNATSMTTAGQSKSSNANRHLLVASSTQPPAASVTAAPTALGDVTAGQTGWLEWISTACNVSMPSNVTMFNGTIAEAAAKVAGLASHAHIAIGLRGTEHQEQLSPLVVNESKVVLIDGGGATIRWPNLRPSKGGHPKDWVSQALRAFYVYGVAQLCIVNTVLDG